VREATLGGASLVPGTWVLLRQNGELVPVTVTRSLDDFIEVDLAGVPTLLPVSDVVARLHHGLVAPPVDPPAVELPPATPITQMVLLDAAPRARAAMLDSCEDGSASVIYPDGTGAQVPTSLLHPLHVRAGDRVTALWSGSPYPAVIMATRGSLVRARWEDTSDQWIESTDVRSINGTVSGTVHGCPHGAVWVEEPARTAVGRLLGCDAATATVITSDGTPRTISRESLVRVPLHLGDAIEASWNGTPYSAVVMAMGERPHVLWSDGTQNDIDPATLLTIQLPEGRASEAPTCPDVPTQ
jgi:hypothetical protein